MPNEELQKDQQQIVKYLPKGANYILSRVETTAKGTKEVWVALTSGGAVTTKLTFKDGVLTKIT